MEEFLNPEQALKQLDLKEEMTAADFGSGSGGWAIPLAKILKEGKVFAIDILEEPLSALKGKAEILNVSNIETIRSNIEKDNGSKLEDNSVDLALITSLLFQAEKKEQVFKEAKRILKKGGKVLVVDWKPDSSLGPKEGKILPEEVKNIAKKIGFVAEREIAAGAYHYGLIFIKS